MKKIFLTALMILLTACIFGCGQEQTATDVNQIPKEVATDTQSDKSDEPSEPAPAPVPQAQAGKDYILAADDLSNLQLADATLPVYDQYTLWQRQEKNLPITLPYLEPYEAESTVYLTFDDGPDDKITPQILDILKAEGVKATFYVCGNMVDAYPNVRARHWQPQLQSPLRRTLRQPVEFHGTNHQNRRID